MLRGPNRLSYILLIYIVVLPIPTILKAQEIHVGPDIHVSTADPQLNHSEVIIAADPSNPRHLLACSLVAPEQPSVQTFRAVAYLSSDGGTGWSKTFDFGGDFGAGDPSCAFGPDGAVYYATLVFESVEGNYNPPSFDFPEAKYKGKTVLHWSSNGGQTWSLKSMLARGDREFLTIDQKKNRIYMSEMYLGTSLNAAIDGMPTFALVIYDSGDSGNSFQPRVLLQSKGAVPIGGHPGGLLSDGTFVTSFSPVGGVGTKVRVLRYNANDPDQATISVVDGLHDCDPRRNSISITSLAVDSTLGIFRDRVYVAWPDSRSGRCEILFSSSADEGKSWSEPLTVNDDRSQMGVNTGPDDFHPVVAVSPTGVVGVLWYDRRDSPDNLGWRPRFSASLDGGQTFLPSVGFGNSGIGLYQGKVLDLEVQRQGGADPFRPGKTVLTTLGYGGHGITGGETAGLAADASGAFHALWVDNRTGTRQVRTAQITVQGTVAKNAANDLGQLDDVSRDVTVLFSNAKLDKTNQTITADAYIQNSSTSNICLPLKLRVLRLESKIGSPKFTNADNRRDGSGAVFDFDRLVRGGVLCPGQRSLGKHIAIHLDGMLSEIATGDYDTLNKMVQLDSVVLGMLDAASSKARATN